MAHACYLDDIIMESEGEKGLGSLVLIEAESRPTVPDLHRTEAHRPLGFEITKLAVFF